MNNVLFLSIVGILLTAAAAGFYIRWRRSPRGLASARLLSILRKESADPEAASAGTAGSAGFSEEEAVLAGVIRRPVAELRRMFVAWILLGILITFLSLLLRSVIPLEDPWWLVFPFLILGLLLAVAGVLSNERLGRAGRMERASAYLARKLRMDLVQVACLSGGAVCILLVAVAAVFTDLTVTGTAVAVTAVSGILLAAGGAWGPPLDRLVYRKGASVDEPADPGTRKAVRKKDRKAARRPRNPR